MGALISSFFQTGGHLLSSSVSDNTRRLVLALLEEMRSKEATHIHWSAIESYLVQIPKGENILSVVGPDNYNLLQRAISFNCVELVRWVLSRGCDVNRGVCSLPLHIAALQGNEEIVELLLKHGARVDSEARMCFPGPHNQVCELCSYVGASASTDRYSERLQSAEYYAIDGDHANILELLLAQGEDSWLPWQQKRPLLHLACERGAWNCVRFLVAERSEELNQCYDEYYPIHQAALQDKKFLELLIQCGAEVTARTTTQQLTVLHVVLLLSKKSADETLSVLRVLQEHGCRDLINEPDSLGNTPLHVLIVRYMIEESRYGYQDPRPWTKWDMLHLVRYLLQNGAGPSINRQGNSALACVLRHVRDWEFRYELLDMLLQSGGDPNCVGRDGSAPLMVCLVPLINKDPLHCLSHTKKVFYLNSVRLLCRHGANPNCRSRSNLTPLHVLVFTASEYITLNRENDKESAFAFISQLLTILLQHGLDPNAHLSQRTQHILLALLDLVQNARQPTDLDYVCALTLALLVHGADPNVQISSSEPIICHSQSSVFLKKASNQVLCYFIQLVNTKTELLADREERFARFIRLYYNTMEHRILYGCLKGALANVAMVPLHTKVARVLRNLYSQPRSLKQIARVGIYKALGRRVAVTVNKLNLPGPLKEYLLFEWTP
ncbi:ankyrin-3-like [Ornithodoros turicata]|uniref:ankyrin-3-like n=1 Tax=Ornithodoros turicata TaxID=34597 RepID=UPI00313A0DBC